MERIKKYEPLWDKWTVKRKLGVSGLAFCYEAECNEYGKTLKCTIAHFEINTDIRTNIDFPMHVKEPFEKEKEMIISNVLFPQILQAIEEHIVIVYDYKFFYDEKTIDMFIRMEYLTNLEKYIQNKTVDSEFVIRMGIDLCKALEACERKEIIHRDVKPENIFVNENETFKLGGFCFACELSSTLISRLAGTPLYMAPEAMSWGEKIDYCSDIYSLGITMYQLLNDGNFPFMSGGEDVDEVYETIKKRENGEEILPPRHGQKELWKIIQKATRFKKEDRYQSASEMRADLEELQLRKKIKKANSLKIEQMKNEIGVLKQDILELKNLEKETRQLNSNSVLNCNVVGNTIFFGRYPQDKDGREKPIEWTVIKTEKNRMLLLSKYVLAAQPYNKNDEKVTWETSGIRRWLNSNFYTAAFNNMEQGKIADTLVKTENNPKYGTIGGNDTEDKVFLLSVEEVEENFQNKEERRAKTTAYAEKLVIRSNEKYAYWVLRTMGDYNCRVVGVRMEGELMMGGIEVSNVAFGVRPALWINL